MWSDIPVVCFAAMRSLHCVAAQRPSRGKSTNPVATTLHVRVFTVECVCLGVCMFVLQRG